MNYTELQVTSHFSFLRGASSPAELVVRAYELGLSGIAIADRNTLAGVVRAFQAAREINKRIKELNESVGEAIQKAPFFQLIVGARLDFVDAPSVLCLPEDRLAYGRLSQMLTDGKMKRSEKGRCTLILDDLMVYGDGQQLIVLPGDQPDGAFKSFLRNLRRRFGDRVSLAAHHLYRGDDAKRLARLADIARVTKVPLVATNDVHAHIPNRRPLQDVLTCIRAGCTMEEAGFRLHANAERHLKPAPEMVRLFRDHPGAIVRTAEIAAACTFSMSELKYEYPAEPVPEGRTPQEELERLVWLHAPRRYPNGIPVKVKTLLENELALIEKLKYARYFLTVRDIVAFADKEEILCQGRGSAANSAVCYVLGITAVDPDTTQLLIDRFLSEERDEPPDIDVDFEHERREEVMQYIFEKYTRDRAGIVATLVTYRPKSAIRDVGKAMGLSEDAIGILSKTLWGWGREGIKDDYIREAGLDPNERNLRNTLILAKQLIGFPRHLSQHTGGFVITRGKLSEVVPIENAAMDDRTVIEWDKDDLDVLGMLKIDVLALGMLTCLRKGFDLLQSHYGVERRLYDNEEDPAVYDMLCKADSVGVFQVESRAQMTMLPRLQPRELYDLVIEVAIVRPGPIQGDMVHPYLARRSGKEKTVYPKPELEEVLKRTCGVPLFQEQAMQIAMVAARFTPDEANALRRAMATFRHNGTIHTLERRFIDGMIANGYEPDFAERCFRQIEGFGEYGFPESHAASFALLVYASSWIKCHYPDVFACAILNSQPMGFYRPAQLIRDAKEHGIEVRPVDVMHSEWDCTLEPLPPDHRSPPRRNGNPPNKARYALRLGFRQLKGLSKGDAGKLVTAREQGDFAGMRSVWLRAGLSARALETMSKGDVWRSLGLNRRGALWATKGLGAAPLPLFAAADREEAAEPAVNLPAMSMGQEVTEDYRHLSLSLKTHPMALLRETLGGMGYCQSERLASLRDGAKVNVAGIVLIRQQPGTASGVIFVTLEDETGVANIVVWPRVFQAFRRELLGSQLMGVSGIVQRDESGYVIHVVADRLMDLSEHLHGLGKPARPYADMLARSDEGRSTGQERHAGIRGRVIPASRDFR